jgi:hypothetical protein
MDNREPQRSHAADGCAVTVAWMVQSVSDNCPISCARRGPGQETAAYTPYSQNGVPVVKGPVALTVMSVCQ